MGLKRKIDTIDGLKPDVAALYTKGEDGKFTLDVEGDSPSDTLESAYRKTKAELAEIKKMRDADRAELAEREAKVKAEQEEALRKAGDLPALEKKWKEEKSNSEKALKAEIDAREREIDKLQRETVIDGLLDGKLIPSAKRLFKRDVMDRTRLERDADGNRIIRVLDEKGNPTPASIEEFIKSNVLDNKDNAPFILSGKGSGSQANGSNAGGQSGAGKVITTEALGKLPLAERHTFFKSGGHIKD